jgi:hypothetical protein
MTEEQGLYERVVFAFADQVLSQPGKVIDLSLWEAFQISARTLVTNGTAEEYLQQVAERSNQ